MSANNVNSRFLLSLYSSDAGGLTFEGEFATYEEAFEVVKGWVPDEDDIEKERLAGMWLIEEEVGPRMQYHVQLMAYYRGEDFNVSHESEKVHPSYESVLFKAFRTRAEAETRMAAAKQQHEESRAIFAKEWDNCVAVQGKDPDHFKIKCRPLPIKGWGQKIKSMIHPDITLDELKALQYPKPGFIGMDEPKDFQVTSGALRTTDPCYSMDTWCAGTLEGVANGKWFARAGHCHDEIDIEWSNKYFTDEIAKLEEATLKLQNGDEDAKFILDYIKMDLLKIGNPMSRPGRVCFMHIRHESVPADEPIDTTKFVKSEIDVGVDSGQAGFFDLKPFEAVAALPNHAEDKDKSHPHHAFYRTCCNTTCDTEKSWGVINGMGVVSSTGWGDGGYNLYVRRNEAGEVIEGRIVYLEPGNEGFIEPEEGEEGDE